MRFHALRCFTALASTYTGEKNKPIGFTSCRGVAQKLRWTAKRINHFCLSAEEIANHTLICSLSAQTPSVNKLFLTKDSPPCACKINLCPAYGVTKLFFFYSWLQRDPRSASHPLKPLDLRRAQPSAGLGPARTI